jgi:hypothetical protein
MAGVVSRLFALHCADSAPNRRKTSRPTKLCSIDDENKRRTHFATTPRAISIARAAANRDSPDVSKTVPFQEMFHFEIPSACIRPHQTYRPISALCLINDGNKHRIQFATSLRSRVATTSALSGAGTLACALTKTTPRLSLTRPRAVPSSSAPPNTMHRVPTTSVFSVVNLVSAHNTCINMIP